MVSIDEVEGSVEDHVDFVEYYEQHVEDEES